MQDDAVDQNWPYNSLALFSNSPVTEQPYPMQQTLADHPKGKAICLLCHAIIYAKMRYTFAAVPLSRHQLGVLWATCPHPYLGLAPATQLYISFPRSRT
ncbi:hypothetical protein HRS9122_05865 [Pyrenophora teres f. teres]|nr:hypothetical protein HRS9122_05865 [Pyrenophora teres f. teres]